MIAVIYATNKLILLMPITNFLRRLSETGYKPELKNEEGNGLTERRRSSVDEDGKVLKELDKFKLNNVNNNVNANNGANTNINTNATASSSIPINKNLSSLYKSDKFFKSSDNLHVSL